MARKASSKSANHIKVDSKLKIRSQRADDEVRKMLPLGVKLVRTLRGHKDWIGRISWSPNGKMLASSSADETFRQWDAETGKCLRMLKGHSAMGITVAFGPESNILATGSYDKNCMVWDAAGGQLLHTLKGHSGSVRSVAFDPKGEYLASGSDDDTIKLWKVANGLLHCTLKGHRRSVMSVVFDSSGEYLASGSVDMQVRLWNVTSGQLVHTFKGHTEAVRSVVFHPKRQEVASASDDRTLKLWDMSTGRLIRTFEGHIDGLQSIGFLHNGDYIVSKGGDGTIRVWQTDDGTCLATFSEHSASRWPLGLACHPSRSLLATVGSDPGTPEEKLDKIVHIYDLDFDLLLRPKLEANACYVNAKVILVGDSGVGKSGLSLVLDNQPFEATESTPGRRVLTLGIKEAITANNIHQTRETLLWDLAGQPGYRIIHQLHLNEVSVAVVVFDARSETDPLAGVRHWERALRLAHQRSGAGGVPMRKFLVSARNDRGVVSVSKDRLHALMEEYKFDGYFETSAKEGWMIDELRTAIEQAIPWKILPEVSSSTLFADIKAFLVSVKETGRLLALPAQLYIEFISTRFGLEQEVKNLRGQFDTCIRGLEARDLIRRLSFGGYVLLQPELLDAYASAMVNAAKEEPEGLGSLAEEMALAGKFYVPKDQKIRDIGQEQLLLHATVEELVHYDLALRENADDGRYLVFPSQFNRDYEDAPEPKGKAAAITFEGPVQSLYATLVVRLGHSGLFTAGRTEMWRNAAVFTAKAGGKCGMFVNEFSEARGRLILFYDEYASQETRYHFEEYVLAHAERRSLEGSITLVRFFVCFNCGEPVPEAYVKKLQDRGKAVFDCPCGVGVPLIEPKERIHFKSTVKEMDKSADQQRDFDAFVTSAKGEASTPSFTEWAGVERLTLAIVFTDVVGSTKLGNELGDSEMDEVRRAHFDQSRKLIRKYQGREIKTIGDSFMAAFKCVGRALDYAMALQKQTGHSLVQVRAGIHIGAMKVAENDVFGRTVNFAARVVGAIKGEEIWLSERAKSDLDTLADKDHRGLKWEKHDGIEMKGFSETATLWSLEK